MTAMPLPMPETAEDACKIAELASLVHRVARDAHTVLEQFLAVQPDNWVLQVMLRVSAVQLEEAWRAEQDAQNTACMMLGEGMEDWDCD